MPDPLIVFGSGGHAKVVVEAVLTRSPGRQIILLDDHPRSSDHSIYGIPVSGSRDRLEEMRGTPVALAIGDNHARSQLLSWLIGHGHPLETVVHPAAVVGRSVRLGDGAFVGAGAIAIADAQVGAAAIINTAASVDHDCLIGEAAHIGPGAHLCGGVRVGTRTLIGVGGSIRPGIAVAEDVILGAGGVVVSDITQAGTYIGSPARRTGG